MSIQQVFYYKIAVHKHNRQLLGHIHAVCCWCLSRLKYNFDDETVQLAFARKNIVNSYDCINNTSIYYLKSNNQAQAIDLLYCDWNCKKITISDTILKSV